MKSHQLITDEMLNKKYIFNPHYVMRNDVNRVVLCSIITHNVISPSTEPDLHTFIHPTYAILISFFRGEKTLEKNIREISSYFNISDESSKLIIGKLILNPVTVAIEYDNNFFYLPKKILIENENNIKRSDLDFERFENIKNLDFETLRLNIPLSVSMLINIKCVTDCIYCYADKRKVYDCTIPLSRIKELILESKNLGLLDFDIRGGEILTYKYWYELLKTVFDAGYTAYISTKCPLKQDDINKLSELGVSEIQISLDSIYEDDLVINLRVAPKYLEQMLNTIKMLDAAEIAIRIKAVITNQIYDLNKVRNFIDYFKRYQHVHRVEITVPGHSAFKTQEEFHAYRLNESQILELTDLVSEVKSLYKYTVNIDNATNDMRSLSFEEKKKSFYQRAICTGNQSSFLILPNGDVTLCEETYFNPNLILGNILNNSIMEVWNSKKAKELYFISQAQLSKDNPCSTCNEFSECRHQMGICWADVISAYGTENWQYPSPDCHYAPPAKNKIKVWDF